MSALFTAFFLSLYLLKGLTYCVFRLPYRASKILISNLPAMKEMMSELMDVVFVPKVIVKQLTLAVALQCGMVSLINLMHQMTKNYYLIC